MLSDLEKVMLMRADEQVHRPDFGAYEKRLAQASEAGGRPRDVDRYERVRELHAAGWKDEAIAAELGAARQTISGIRQRLGLPSKHSVASKKRGAR